MSGIFVSALATGRVTNAWNIKLGGEKFVDKAKKHE